MSSTINKIILLLIPVSFLLYVNSCSTVKSIFGKNAKTEEKAKTKVEDVQKAQSQNVQSKMDQVAVLASGTGYALNMVSNKEPPLFVAKDINNRVISLAGKPSLDAEKEMWKTIDDLTSQVIKEKQNGLKSLQKKDKEISDLQEETKTLADAKNTEIDKYMKLASDTALKADTLKNELNKMDSWFGLGAIFYGTKKLVISFMWIIGISGAIFLILRIFASSNPIAGAAFKIFDVMGGYLIKGINILIPKALEFSGSIATSAYNEAKILLTKIVDNIEYIKQMEKTTGQPITLKQLFVELDKSMDIKEKSIIDDIKKKLGY